MTSQGSRGASKETGEGVLADVTAAVEQALNAMGCGVWHCAGETGEVYPPPTLGRLFGPSGETVAVEPVSTGPRGAELQVSLRGGETRWLECRQAVARDEYGTITGVTGVVLDITDRKQQEEAARREIAVRQAALEERDQVLRVLQRSLLPPQLPHIDGVDLATRYLPMGGGIGGDFYDMFLLKNGAWGIMLGDVCGKGAPAASTTALARYTIRAAALAGLEPAAALELLNHALTTVESDAESRFCTAIFAHLDPSGSFVRLRPAIAGHPPILVLRSDGTLEAHGPTGPLLGVLENVVIEQRVIDLRPGDACVLYTDGATDVRHGRDTFGDNRLADVVSSCRAMSAEAIAAQIENAVVSFQEGDMRDDFALVVLVIPTLDVS